MWLRFETQYRDYQSHWATGVFQYAYVIRDDLDIDRDTRIRIRKLLTWFHENLPAPPRSEIERRSIFWFKARLDLARPAKISPWKRRPLTKLAARAPKPVIPSDRPIDQPAAACAISKLRELLPLMDRAGYATRIISTRRPGYVVYEDPFQIAAIPFRDAVDEHCLEGWIAE